jgi:MFS family permease
MKIAWMLRALQYRNYRLFFSGQIISLVGNWMTQLATSWLVFRLTGSTLMLGTVGFAGQIPAFVLALFAGVWVDRWNRHLILKVTQTLAMLQSFALAYLALTNQITVSHIIALSMVQGCINAFDMPARQSFVVQMVERKEDLSNAIALNSSMVNAARLVGPALAGAIIALVGEGWCFFLDGVSYLAVLISLMMMQVLAPAAPKKQQAPVAALREGWLYVSRFAPIRTILLLMAAVSLLGLPYTVLMPAVATQILHGDAHTQGYLMAGSGVGALAGAIFLASRRSVLGLGRLIPYATGMLGVGLIAFSFSSNFWVSLALMPLLGFGFMVQMASCNTLLQTIVEEDKRGRVMSFFTMSFMGTAPFGSLLAGAMSQRYGVPHTILFCGVCSLGAAAWFASQLPSLRELVRPIYRTLGILPLEIAGVGQATELVSQPEHR